MIHLFFFFLKYQENRDPACELQCQLEHLCKESLILVNRNVKKEMYNFFKKCKPTSLHISNALINYIIILKKYNFNVFPKVPITSNFKFSKTS